MAGSRLGQSALTLNIAPISFSRDTVRLGRVEYTDHAAYRGLSDRYRDTHVLRLDRRDNRIVNLALVAGTEALGEVSEEPAREHLLLLGRAVQQSILVWLAKTFTILRRSHPLMFWGSAAKSRLLSRALEDEGLTPRDRLEVLARYAFDTRLLQGPGDEARHYLALLIDLGTSNVIDIPASELLEAGVDIKGKYVCKRESSDDEYLRPKLDALGRVSTVLAGDLLLADAPGPDRIPAEEALLEPRQENLEAVVQAFYGEKAAGVLGRLQQLRAPLASANGKLAQIKQTLKNLRERHEIRIGNDLVAHLGDLLDADAPLFPASISTTRPSLLFGPQGNETGQYPDLGIQQWGPYKYMQNERNEPLIAVVCEAQHRGRVEQFVEALRSGFPRSHWERATARQREPRANPYEGGLTGKFRLQRVNLEYEDVRAPNAQAYRDAALRLLTRLPARPDLALVQIRQSFEQLRGDDNPYLVSKAVFMLAGVPVQSIRLENIDAPEFGLPYILNNIAVQSYAKMGGVPWVISTRGPTSHEIVIGLGYTEIGEGRLATRTRYVGITTLFQGDGRYLVWGLTREVEFEDYAEALLENLRTTVRYVRDENSWQPGDQVRLIFHVYKPLKHREMEAIRGLVSALVSDDYKVEYAFIDISHHHEYELFDPREPGLPYYSALSGRKKKGVGVPARGLCLQLGRRTALLHLTGPRELKSATQGVPRPLLIEVHPQSDFDDLTYLSRQIFHFTHVSWRSFFPATEPVTISYSRLIARALGSLRAVTGWNSTVLTVGSLRNSKWFL